MAAGHPEAVVLVCSLAAQLLGTLLSLGLGFVEALGVGHGLAWEEYRAEQGHGTQHQAAIRNGRGHRIGSTRVCRVRRVGACGAAR